MPLLVTKDTQEVHATGWLWSRISRGKWDLATTVCVNKEYLGCPFLHFLLSFTE